MCTQLSADSPLGPQVASSLRYCQLERGEMEGGRKEGRGKGGGEESKREGRVWQEETRAESDGKRSGQHASVGERDADKCATRGKMGFMW